MPVYNVTFTPTLGAMGTLIEYKVEGDSEWITPISPANPTTLATYPLDLEGGNVYNIRVSSYGSTCAPKYKLLRVSVAGSECCPDTYDLSEDGTYCLKVETVDATSPTTGENAVSKDSNQYTQVGTNIYLHGYNIDGTGPSDPISLSNNYWWNFDGNTEGPMNRAAVWAVSENVNQYVGFSTCIVIPESRTYYIGMGADNSSIIRVNGTTILEQSPAALDAQYSLGGACFKIWHIYPVDLLAGNNIVEVIGYNSSSIAAVGAQIYDNTVLDLKGATSDEDLNIIFNTKDFVGEPVQIGNGGIGYTCPEGYSLVMCDGSPYCSRTLTASKNPC